jgi:hypothetical protein
MMRALVALNAEADAVCALLDGGTLELLSGTPPASPTTAIRAQTRLARLRFQTPAFQPAQHGSAVAYPLVPDIAAAAGEPTWFRAVRPDGTPVFDGTIGAGKADLALSSARLVAGSTVRLADLTYVATR